MKKTVIPFLTIFGLPLVLMAGLLIREYMWMQENGGKPRPLTFINYENEKK